jgi:hypothetical protein
MTIINNQKTTIMSIRKISFVNYGYVFNKESQMLESFKLIEARFNLKDNNVHYTAVVGGENVEFCDDNLKVYQNEEEYKNGKHLSGVSKDYHIQRLLNYDDYGMCWTYDNGDAVQVSAEDIPLLYIVKGNEIVTDDGKRFFGNKATVWKYNDLVVKREDGSIETIECIYNKMKMTDTQMAIIEKLRKVWQEARDNGIELYTHACDCKLMAINTQNKCIYGTEYFTNSEDGDTYYDVTDMAVEVCRGIWDKYEEYSVLVEK